MAYLVPSLVQLRSEANARYPGRDKSSDGWIGDAAHGATNSDHNPDSRGAVHAFDLDEDIDGNVTNSGADLAFFAEHIRSIRDPRVKYVIYEGRIFAGNQGPSPWVWRTYSGANAHSKHMHISVLSTAIGENDTRNWFPSVQIVEPLEPEDELDLHLIRRGSDGAVFRIGVGAPKHVGTMAEYQALLTARVRVIGYPDAATADQHLAAATEEWNDRKAAVLYAAGTYGESVELSENLADIEELLTHTDAPTE